MAPQSNTMSDNSKIGKYNAIQLHRTLFGIDLNSNDSAMHFNRYYDAYQINGFDLLPATHTNIKNNTMWMRLTGMNTDLWRGKANAKQTKIKSYERSYTIIQTDISCDLILLKHCNNKWAKQNWKWNENCIWYYILWSMGNEQWAMGAFMLRVVFVLYFGFIFSDKQQMKFDITNFKAK